MKTPKASHKPRTDDPSVAGPAEPKQIIGRFVDSPGTNGRGDAVAVFCHEAPGSFIGTHVEQIVRHLAARGRYVHLFCREAFGLDAPGVKVHAVGAGDEGDVVAQAKDFEHQREHSERQDRNFDFSRGFFQIAIVLASVAIVAGSRPMLAVALILGALATILALNGFLLLFDLPGATLVPADAPH